MTINSVHATCPCEIGYKSLQCKYGTNFLYIYIDFARNLAIGEKNICFIQLDTPKLTQKQMSKIEDVCNDLIRQGVPMTPHWYSPDAPELEGVSPYQLKAYY